MVVVQYERTKDASRMLTSGQIAQAILTAVRRGFRGQPLESNIFDVLPARTTTSIEYKKGANEAWFWNEGGSKKKLPFPVKPGYYLLGEGADEFGVPNGDPSNRNDPNALYLVRNPSQDFSGPVGLGNGYGGNGGRTFVAVDLWSVGSGVALVEDRDVAVEILSQFEKGAYRSSGVPVATVRVSGEIIEAAEAEYIRLAAILPHEQIVAYRKLLDSLRVKNNLSFDID